MQLKNTNGENIIFPIVSKGFIQEKVRIANSQSAFRIEKITLNSKPQTDNLIVKEEYTIPGKADIEIFFSINQVLKQGAIKPYDNSQAVPKIPKGKYLFLLSVPIYKESSVYLMVLSPAVAIEFL